MYSPSLRLRTKTHPNSDMSFSFQNTNRRTDSRNPVTVNRHEVCSDQQGRYKETNEITAEVNSFITCMHLQRIIAAILPP